MRNVRQLGGVIALLVMLAGCAVPTHTSKADGALPTCEKTLLELNQLTTSLPSKDHIPLAIPGPLHFCRYRWNNNNNKLELKFDDTELLAPVAILQALSKLKTVNEVYGLNAVFLCPLMLGNADILILRAATGSALTVIQVQRDGCGRVVLTHPGSKSYIVYLSSTQLLNQLDAIRPTGGRPTKNLPQIRVTPSSNLRNGEAVLVQVSGAIAGERFRISECASASAMNRNGCGDQLALQPFIDTDPAGSGSTTYDVKTKAATMPYNTSILRTCTDQCVIMATGTDMNGKAAFFNAPIIFSN